MEKGSNSYDADRKKLLENYSKSELAFYKEIIEESENYQLQNNTTYKFVLREDGSNG